MIFLYILFALVCLIHVYVFRHNIAETRGELLAYVIVACIPWANVVILCAVWYFVKCRESVVNWMKGPFL
jgi:hypothetical protein